MSTLLINQQTPGVFNVAGDLTFASIDKKTVESLPFLTSSRSVTVDLGQVTNTDSGGLALLIEWIKFARGKRVELTFRNIPDQLIKLASLSGLETTDFFCLKSGITG